MHATLLVLRHGPARDPLPGQPDAQRPLRGSGRRLVESLGEGLKACGWVPDQALTSPYLRALETLSALERGMGRGVPSRTAIELVPGGDLGSAEMLLRAFMAEAEPGSRVLAVSHLPLAELLVFRLAGLRVGLGTAHGVLLDWDGHRFRAMGRIQPEAPFLVNG